MANTLQRSVPIALKINVTSGENTLAKQREMLRKVTTTGVDLDSLYGQTLQQIREQTGDRPRLGMQALMWVSHAERPLRIDELCHALAFGMEATDLDPKSIQPADTVMGSCLGLAMVDKRTSIVRLIHDTLQKYLSRPGILSGAHKVLGETCLAYLNSDQVKQLRASKVGDLGHMPFLEYSSLYWGVHAKIELSDRAKTLALEVLNRFEKHISFTLYFEKKLIYCFPNPNSPFTGLHCASYLGIDALVAALIKVQSCNVDQKDSAGYTPLMRAVSRGNQGAAKLLLTCDGVDPNKSNISGITPLWWACSCGDEQMVRLLIQVGANPHKPDISGLTPLMIASRRINKGILALLQPQAVTISDLE